MNKKPIDTLLQHQNFNNQLFKQSISLVQQTKNITPVSKIPIEILRTKPELKKKQQTIQTYLSKSIKLFGQILGTEKNTLGTVTDYAVQVFEQLTDLIQTQCQSFIDKKKNIKVNKQKEKENQQQVENNKILSGRPQQKYPFIKPCESFDHHSHSKPSQENLRLKCQKPISSNPLSQPYIYVCTIDSLQKMILQLESCKEIAVDLEHSNKSYEGFTCLMQISSRVKDYIIDVFPIWEHIPKLKKLFENQKIIKVMHGAEMDTKWLQRDFNIHIRNLFDTYKASRVLGFPKFSYAYLLHHYCGASTDKKYQLADWRQRPLMPEMLHYARLDTHYLLEIWDKVLIDLCKQAQSMNIDTETAVKQVYKASHQVTLCQVQLFSYKKKEIYQNIKNDTKPQDFQIIQSIFWIIDKIAKKQDQSFDDLVNKRTLVDILGRTKDLIQNKRATIDMLRVKIDRLIGVLRSHKHEKIGLLLPALKKQLETFFLQPKKQIESGKKKIKTPQQSLIQQISEKKAAATSQVRKEGEQIFKAQAPNILIQQFDYPLKTYENFSIQQKTTNKRNAFSMLQFQPIMTFLSKKFNIAQKAQNSQLQEQKNLEMDLESQQLSQQQKNQQQNQGEKQDEGFLEFKRIKPNVIYTIEQQEDVQQIKSKPKKKRKEQEYQKKLRNKEGNIYDLLQQV